MSILQELDVCLIVGLNDDILLNNIPCFFLATKGNKCAIYISGDISLHQIYNHNLLYEPSLNSDNNKIVNIKNNVLIHKDLFIFIDVNNYICFDEINNSKIPKTIINKCIKAWKNNKLNCLC